MQGQKECQPQQTSHDKTCRENIQEEDQTLQFQLAQDLSMHTSEYSVSTSSQDVSECNDVYQADDTGPFPNVLDEDALDLIASNGGSHFMAPIFEGEQQQETGKESALEETINHKIYRKQKMENEKKESKRRRINKLLRMQGKEYYGERKTADGYELVLRSKVEMGKPCDSVKCQMSKNTRFCHIFNEEDRKKLFNDFWKLSWDLRKIYVKSLSTLTTPKRRSSTKDSNKRKQIESHFFLPKGSTRHQVCKFTFASTLGIKNSVLRTWVRDGETPATIVKPVEAKSKYEAKTHLKNFLALLPGVQSKSQVHQPFKTKHQMYSFYKEHAASLGITALSLTTFLGRLSTAHLGLLEPGTDPSDPTPDDVRVQPGSNHKAAVPTTIAATTTNDETILSSQVQSENGLSPTVKAALRSRLLDVRAPVLNVQALNLVTANRGSHFMAAALAAKQGVEGADNPAPGSTGRVKAGNEKKERKDRRINKLLRMQGKEYYGERKTANGYELVLRGKKVMGKPCDSNKCQMSKNTRFCYVFTEKDREKLFSEFWKLSWEMRKAYVKKMTTVTTPKRRSVSAKLSGRKQLETQFFLPKSSKKYQVCKFTFLSTLGIKDWALRSWARSDNEKEESEKKPVEYKSRIEPAKTYLKNYLVLLSTIPNSLPFKSKRQVYGCYCAHAENQGMSALSWPTFLAVFNESHLNLLEPHLEQEGASAAAEITSWAQGAAQASETQCRCEGAVNGSYPEWAETPSFPSVPDSSRDSDTLTLRKSVKGTPGTPHHASQSAHQQGVKTDTACNYYNDATGLSIELVPQNFSREGCFSDLLQSNKHSVASNTKFDYEIAHEQYCSDTSNKSVEVVIDLDDVRNTNRKITKVENKILCQHCGIAFENSWFLNVHHDNINYCKCCNLTFVSKKERLYHLNKEHAEYFRCPCGKICEETGSKRIHKKYCTRNYCYKCRIRLNTCDLFEEHVMENHVSVSECPFCEHKFGAVSKMMIHYQLHTLIQPILK